MLSRLFCSHCEKYYKVDVENIKLVQEHMESNLRYANNTYYYDNGCFFKELNRLKILTIGENGKCKIQH
jgi:hypothetical protein